MDNTKKKVIIASLFAILMLMVPFSAVAGEGDVLEELSSREETDACSLAANLEERLNVLYDRLEEVEEKELRDTIRSTIDAMLEGDLETSIVNMREVFESQDGDILYGSQQMMEELSSIPANGGGGGDLPDNLFELIVWILEAIVEYLITGVQTLIYQIYDAVATLVEGVKQAINVTGDIVDTIFNPGPIADLIKLTAGCGASLIVMILLRPNIPVMIKDGIKALIIGTFTLTFQKLYEFSEPRLGYVGDFVPYTLDVLMQYETLRLDIDTKIQRVKIVFIDFPKALLDFIYAQNLIDRAQKLLVAITAIGGAAVAAQEWLADVMDGDPEIINGVMALLSDLTWLKDYVESEPWKAPIHIFGTVTGWTEGDVTFSCGQGDWKDTCTTSGDEGNFSINYSTVDAAQFPCKLHMPEVTIYDDEDHRIGTIIRAAFSKGEMQLSIDFDGGSGGGIVFGQSVNMNSQSAAMGKETVQQSQQSTTY
ncbi:MAG: hypothetical protein JW771_07020 [Candidatus Thermoplasmatota archaeon]|nr:hypothetical protein [Candidatus Thermoplasmatota archaeon]